MIIKTEKFNNYTVYHNSVINDTRLSHREFMILIRLLSKPETWTVNVNAISKECRISINYVYEAIKNLIEYGYIERSQSNNGGSFGKFEYKIYDLPLNKGCETVTPNNEANNTTTASQSTAIRKTAIRKPVNILNTDVINKELIKENNFKQKFETTFMCEISDDIKTKLYVPYEVFGLPDDYEIGHQFLQYLDNNKQITEAQWRKACEKVKAYREPKSSKYPTLIDIIEALQVEMHPVTEHVGANGSCVLMP